MKNNILYEKFKATKVHVTSKILFETQEHIRKHSLYGHEGMVLWSGVKTHGEALVRTCIHPSQQCTAVSYDIPLEETQRVNVLLEQLKEVLIAQIHSHPGSAFHSHRDDAMPFTFKLGFFSLVIPNFCNNDLKNLLGLSVWEYTGEGKWQELSLPSAVWP